MAVTPLYTGDTVALQADHTLIGVVDVENNQVSLATDYPEGVTPAPNLTDEDYTTFLQTGIPPLGCVVVSWIPVPWHTKEYLPELVAESDLKLIDRELLVGNVVKKRPDDAASGVVIKAEILVDLGLPKPWPPPGSLKDFSDLTEDDLNFGHFHHDYQQQLHKIPARELEWPRETDLGESPFIVYEDWFGEIIDFVETHTLRLLNGSIVEVETRQIWPWDFDESQVESDDEMPTPPQLGDWVKTRKGNIRRGRFLYGAYDANAQPQGLVIAVKVEEMVVRWLYARPQDNQKPQPPESLHRGLIDEDEARLYDRYREPIVSKTSTITSTPTPLGIALGDRVRFRDPAAAAAKYDGTNLENGKFERIPRTETLGFDANNFYVAGSTTQVTIRWQDATTSVHDAKDLVPVLGFDDDGETWPGELIFSKKVNDPDSEYPAVGVVQNVNARDRIASVRWFPDARWSVLADYDGIVPGSFSGNPNKTEEAISMYDITANLSVSRKLGDMVVLVPFLGTPEEFLKCNSTHRYDEIGQALTADWDWIGEVIGLGLDGMLTVRLGLSDNFRDIKVPWECTLMAFAADAFDDDDLMDEGSSASELSSFRSEEDGVWEDEHGRPIGQDGAEDDEWVDEDDSDAMDIDDDPTVAMPGAFATPVHSDELAAHQDSQPNRKDVTLSQHSGPGPEQHVTSEFTYDSMFARDISLSPHQPPEPFAILDGPPPSDHQYISADSPASGPRLRRIQKEYSILTSSLPAGVYVRTWESAMHLMRILILGPVGTPYEYAPFLFDLHLHSGFPSEPPQAYFHSWTNETINPNLYIDGRICLSLLGTWPGNNADDTWSTKSTVLQLIVSMVGLVLVKQPWYNEAGFEIRVGTDDSKVPARVYSERTFLNTRAYISQGLTRRPGGVADILDALYRVGSSDHPWLLLRAIWTGVEVIHRSKKMHQSSDGDAESNAPLLLSPGALISLKRDLKLLISHIANSIDAPNVTELADSLTAWIDDEAAYPRSNDSNGLIAALGNGKG